MWRSSVVVTLALTCTLASPPAAAIPPGNSPLGHKVRAWRASAAQLVSRACHWSHDARAAGRATRSRRGRRLALTLTRRSRNQTGFVGEGLWPARREPLAFSG